jgi:hypothetical protein
MTLLVNRVGILQKQLDDSSGELYLDTLLCNIGLNTWYIYLTVVIGVSLLVTLARFFYYKSANQESILIYLSELFVINALLTAVFIKANEMYFS